MEDNKEYGYTNVGTDGVAKIPVESKEPTLIPDSVKKGLEEAKEGKLVDSPEDFSKFVDKELRSMSPEELAAQFDETQAIIVPAKKKRGRPKKAVKIEPIREWYCATCREKYLEQALMKMPAGDGRFAIFCGQCQKSLGFLQPDVDAKIAKLHKNPSKK